MLTVLFFNHVQIGKPSLLIDSFFFLISFLDPGSASLQRVFILLEIISIT
jgi:hypothetical protein